MSKSKNDKPIREVTYWPVRVAIWRNVHEESGRANYTTSVSRLYKTPEEEWKSTSGLDLEDLLPAARALAEAFGIIHELLASDRKAAA